jgi:hypothetical protein
LVNRFNGAISALLYNIILFQVKTFFRKKIKTTNCGCGEALAVSLSKATSFAHMKKTPAAISHYITTKGIGCRGKTMHVGKSSKTRVHISWSKL